MVSALSVLLSIRFACSISRVRLAPNDCDCFFYPGPLISLCYRICAGSACRARPLRNRSRSMWPPVSGACPPARRPCAAPPAAAAHPPGEWPIYGGYSVPRNVLFPRRSISSLCGGNCCALLCNSHLKVTKKVGIAVAWDGTCCSKRWELLQQEVGIAAARGGNCCSKRWELLQQELEIVEEKSLFCERYKLAL